jgi:hypothetical protein
MREHHTPISFRNYPSVPVAFSGRSDHAGKGLICKHGIFFIITDWRPKTVQQVDEERAGWKPRDSNLKNELSLSFYDERNGLGAKSSPVAVLVAYHGQDDSGLEVCEKAYHCRTFFERITFKSARPSKVRLKLYLSHGILDLGTTIIPSDKHAATVDLTTLVLIRLGVDVLAAVEEPELVGDACAGWYSKCFTEGSTAGPGRC